MYTLAQRILESCPRMCGFLGEQSDFSGCEYSLGDPPFECLGGSPLSQGEGQTIAELRLFPSENGRPTCEGTCEGTDSEKEKII